MYFNDPRPAVPITLVSSSARTTSSNSGNLKDTTGHLPMAESLSIFLNVTAHTVNTTQNTNAFDLFLDVSPDDGTTWLMAQRWPRVTSSAAVRSINFRRGVGMGNEASTVDSLATNSTSAAIGNIALTRDVRVRWEMTTGESVTFAVYAMASAS